MHRTKNALVVGLLGFTSLCPLEGVSQTTDVLRGLDSMNKGLQPDSHFKRSQPKGSSAPPAPQDNPWTKVKPGMDETAVMKILGVPDRVDNQEKIFQWRWDKGPSKGWVNFDNASRKVIEWRSL